MERHEQGDNLFGLGRSRSTLVKNRVLRLPAGTLAVCWDNWCTSGSRIIHDSTETSPVRDARVKVVALFNQRENELERRGEERNLKSPFLGGGLHKHSHLKPIVLSEQSLTCVKCSWLKIKLRNKRQ